MDIVDILESNNRGNKLFPAIRLQRARKRVMEQNKPWNGRMRASHLSFNSCPYTFFRNRPTYGDKERNNYLAYAGNSAHKEFQDEIATLTGSVALWEAPSFVKMPEVFPRPWGGTCIELPVYSEEYSMLGYIDAVLRIKGIDGPVVSDIKTKNVSDKSSWRTMAKIDLPTSEHVAQLAAYKYLVNILGYFKEMCNVVHVAYYNRTMIGDMDAEYEFFLNPPEDTTKYMLDNWNTERVRFLNGIDDYGCTYKYCPDHGTEKLNIREWLT